MKEHLPDHDPRLISVDRVGDQRRVDLSDRRSIEARLERIAPVAAVQLQTIASILRKLAASLRKSSGSGIDPKELTIGRKRGSGD
jgi:hypothetical protein